MLQGGGAGVEFNVSNSKRLTYERGLTKICFVSAICKANETAKTAKPDTNTSVFCNITYRTNVDRGSTATGMSVTNHTRRWMGGCVYLRHPHPPSWKSAACLKADLENFCNRENHNGSNLAVETTRRNRLTDKQAIEVVSSPEYYEFHPRSV
jgi:hypothetical protein